MQLCMFKNGMCIKNMLNDFNKMNAVRNVNIRGKLKLASPLAQMHDIFCFHGTMCTLLQ